MRDMSLNPELDDNTPKDPDAYIVGYTIDPDDDEPQDPDTYIHSGADEDQDIQ